MIPLILAQICECPPEGGICLTKEQRAQVTAAIEELDDIKNSKAEVEILEPIIIIRDWEDRVYINGGEKKPIKLKLRIGKTINRDMEMTLPIQVGYREEPPDPMFRLRIRAQAGFLIPTIFESPIKEHILDGMDAGIGWDFFHLDLVNLSVYTGIRSVGGGLGLDLTKNFGPYLGYSLVYDGLKSNALAGIYFSFN